MAESRPPDDEAEGRQTVHGGGNPMPGIRGGVVWFTGLSGSGKSTLARLLEQRLVDRQQRCYVLDGDVLRLGLCKDLGFSVKDRQENIRRAGEVAALFADASIIAIAAFISPFISDRAAVRALHRTGAFAEVYLSTSLADCERRDPKGLYRKARSGQLKLFTGIDAPYEAPPAPELQLDTAKLAPQDCIDQVIAVMIRLGMLPAP